MKMKTAMEIVDAVEKRLGELLASNVSSYQESMQRLLMEEISALRVTLEELPRMQGMLAAATAEQPDFLQVGTFDLSSLHPNYLLNESRLQQAVMAQFTLQQNGARCDVPTLPYGHATSSEVVRCLSAKGLAADKKYRFAFMCWEEPS